MNARVSVMLSLLALFAAVLGAGGGMAGASPAAAPSAPLDAARVMAQVQAFYDRTPDLVAEFHQAVTSDLYGPQPPAHGTVYLKKGGRMLWDYDRPERQQFISDGKVLWVYQPEDNQVIRQDLTQSALPTAVTFLTGTGRLANDFTGKAAARADGAVVLTLTPRSASGVLDQLELVLDPKTYQVRESIVHQTDGQTNDIRFDGVRTGTGLKDAKFAFTPPPGVTIVDPSKLGGQGGGTR